MLDLRIFDFKFRSTLSFIKLIRDLPEALELFTTNWYKWWLKINELKVTNCRSVVVSVSFSFVQWNLFNFKFEFVYDNRFLFNGQRLRAALTTQIDDYNGEEQSKAKDSSRWNLVFVILVWIIIVCSYSEFVSSLAKPFVFSYETIFLLYIYLANPYLSKTNHLPRNDPASWKMSVVNFGN